MNFLFDIDDTAYDQLEPFERAFNQHFKKYEAQVSVEQLYLYSRKFSDLVFELTATGEMKVEDMHIYRIVEALKSFQIEIDSEEALAFQQSYHQNQKEIHLAADIRETLDFCVAKGFKVGVITNGPDVHQKMKIEQLGLEKWIPRENWFISGALHMTKPDPRIFAYAAQKMQINPAETYYIGDSFANDVVGAKGAGWHSIWYNKRSHQFPVDTIVRPDDIATRQRSLFKIVSEC